MAGNDILLPATVETVLLNKFFEVLKSRD